ncbi:MAG: metalloregulator ArsR/SmtB family transcription factor [bacterium]
MNSSDKTLIFKALGDDTRQKILNMLKSGTLCGCTILDKLDITQPTLSHHMKLLCELNIVTCERNGKWSNYTLNKNLFKDLINDLNELIV